MVRKLGIQWTRSLSSQLTKEIKNYNARLKAAERRGLPKELLPKKIRLSEVKKTIKTSKELRNLRQEMKMATSKSLVQTPRGDTKYNQQIRARRRRLERYQERKVNIEKQLERMEKPSTGKFPDERQMIVQEIEKFEGKRPYTRFMNWLQRNFDRAVQWKENYQVAVYNQMIVAQYAGDEEAYEVLEELYQKIERMDLRDYLIGQLTNPQHLAIDYIYPGPGGEMASRYKRIIAEWDSVYD